MYKQVEKPKDNIIRGVANSVTQKKSSRKQGFGFVDNRPEAVAERKLHMMANNSKQVKQLGVYQKMANNEAQVRQTAPLNMKSSPNHPIQRLESGDDYSHDKLASIAIENDWWEKDHGEFLAPPEITEDYEKDTYQYEMHYHQYSNELKKSEDEVSLSGHAVWAKEGNKSRRQKYGITSKKSENGYWYIDNDSALGDVELGFDRDKNPDAKEKILGTFGDLKSIVEETMNSDDDGNSDSD